ncbi:macrophage migration inhibitory factor homolog isoform X1 [Apostichopus japonicus]|uniref:macrophage migration inhibitory factor homolog isoform X1 n=1 Tax=Stichopus japonicus TaxID=307972 RepID=UPI003AB10D1D
MPLCVVHTNKASETISDSTIKKLCQLVVDALGSKVSSVTVEMRSGKLMCRAGDPSKSWGFFELHGTNNFLDPKDTLAVGNKMFEFGVNELDIPRNCLFVLMHEHDAKHVGIRGNQFLVDLPHYSNYVKPDYYKDLRK